MAKDEKKAPTMAERWASDEAEGFGFETVEEAPKAEKDEEK